MSKFVFTQNSKAVFLSLYAKQNWTDDANERHSSGKRSQIYHMKQRQWVWVKTIQRLDDALFASLRQYGCGCVSIAAIQQPKPHSHIKQNLILASCPWWDNTRVHGCASIVSQLAWKHIILGCWIHCTAQSPVQIHQRSWKRQAENSNCPLMLCYLFKLFFSKCILISGLWTTWLKFR